MSPRERFLVKVAAWILGAMGITHFAPTGPITAEEPYTAVVAVDSCKCSRTLQPYHDTGDTTTISYTKGQEIGRFCGKKSKEIECTLNGLSEWTHTNCPLECVTLRPTPKLSEVVRKKALMSSIPCAKQIFEQHLPQPIRTALSKEFPQYLPPVVNAAMDDPSRAMSPGMPKFWVTLKTAGSKEGDKWVVLFFRSAADMVDERASWAVIEEKSRKILWSDYIKFPLRSSENTLYRLGIIEDTCKAKRTLLFAYAPIDEYAELRGPYFIEEPGGRLSYIPEEDFLRTTGVGDLFLYVTGQFEGRCFESIFRAETLEFGTCSGVLR